MISKLTKQKANILKIALAIGKEIILYCTHYGVALGIFIIGIVVMNWPYLQ